MCDGAGLVLVREVEQELQHIFFPEEAKGAHGSNEVSELNGAILVYSVHMCEHMACKQGRRLFEELELAHGDGRFPRLFRSITKAQLLILDDWGPDRLTATQRRDLMEIVEERYGRGSTMITSQLPIKAWHDVIGEPTFADAILDRIVHNAYRLELKGPSMRKSVTKMDDENPQT